jgi:elongation factor G
MPPQVSVNGEIIPCDAGKPVCAFVYKSVSEPHVGELSFMKVFSGTLRSGMELMNETTGVSEKLNQLYVMEGNKRSVVSELSAGDIGATLKLKNTHVNNTLHERSVNFALKPIVFPAPNMSIAVRTVKKGEEEKLAAALHQLREEDPTVMVEVSSELKQTIIYCQGDMHLAVIKWKLQHRAFLTGKR